MHLGLIAGNGRFPFLVLEAARGAGHDVTVIALKEEAFPDLDAVAAQAPAAALHWVSLGQLGTWIELLEARRRDPGGDGGSGQAHQAVRRHRARPDGDRAC